MKEQKLLNHKACGIGEFISKELNNSLVISYKKEFPGVLSEFSISSELVKNVLFQHDSITGLRFAMGLKDTLNPNSSRILLIPCTHSEKGFDPIPLVSKKGYFDVDGEIVSIKEACMLIANKAIYRKAHNPNLIYKDIERFSFAGRNILLDLLNIPECKSLSFEFGFENNRVTTIVSPLDSKGENINEVYADRMSLSPPDGDGCVAELITNTKSNSEDLNILRTFRNNQLLNIENGDWLYEMYYFVSPLVTYKINDANNQSKLIEMLYHKVKLMVQLIRSERHEEVVSVFEETLEELVDNYEEELVY